MDITFDSAKDEGDKNKRGVTLELASKIDWPEVLWQPDTRKDCGELREVGYTVIDGRLYCVVFPQRGDVMHVISLRKANPREVRHYARYD